MKILGMLILLTAILAGASCLVFFQVEETEFAIVTLFGNPKRILDEPGLALRWPWPLSEVVRIDKRVRIADILDNSDPERPKESEYLTRDKKNVLVSFFAAWRVTDPLKFLVSVNDATGAESRLADILRSELGAELGRYDLADLVSVGILEAQGDGDGEEGGLSMDDLLRVPPPGSTRIPEIMDRVASRTAAAAAKDFGIEVLGAGLKRLNFPRQNKQAVFDRMVAERERIAVEYRSRGKEQADKLKANADRSREELINEAERKAEEIRGLADAEATRIYAEAYGLDPDFYGFIRSLEAYHRVLNEDDLIIIPPESKLLEYLKDPDRGGSLRSAGETKDAAGKER